MSRIKFLFFAILFGVPVFSSFLAIFLTAPALHLICVYVLLTIFVPYSVGLFSGTLLCIFLGLLTILIICQLRRGSPVRLSCLSGLKESASSCHPLCFSPFFPHFPHFTSQRSEANDGKNCLHCFCLECKVIGFTRRLKCILG